MSLNVKLRQSQFQNVSFSGKFFQGDQQQAREVADRLQKGLMKFIPPFVERLVTAPEHVLQLIKNAMGDDVVLVKNKNMMLVRNTEVCIKAFENRLKTLVDERISQTIQIGMCAECELSSEVIPMFDSTTNQTVLIRYCPGCI